MVCWFTLIYLTHLLKKIFGVDAIWGVKDRRSTFKVNHGVELWSVTGRMVHFLFDLPRWKCSSHVKLYDNSKMESSVLFLFNRTLQTLYLLFIMFRRLPPVSIFPREFFRLSSSLVFLSAPYNEEGGVIVRRKKQHKTNIKREHSNKYNWKKFCSYERNFNPFAITYVQGM